MGAWRSRERDEPGSLDVPTGYDPAECLVAAVSVEPRRRSDGLGTFDPARTAERRLTATVQVGCARR